MPLDSRLDEKILLVLAAPATEPLDRDVLRELSGRCGARNAVRAAELVAALGMSPCEYSRRVVAGAIESLVIRHGIPIGGLRVPPYGYFLIETAEDLRRALAPLTGELHALLRRIRALAGPAEVARLYGQEMLRLDFATDASSASDALPEPRS